MQLPVTGDTTSEDEKEPMTTAGIIGLNPSKPKPGTAAALSTEDAALMNEDADDQ